LDKEVVSLGKVKGTDSVASEKANKDATESLEKAISTYSYGVLKEYLDGALVSGTGFDSKKMREFSVEVAKELITSAEKRGDWKTSKNEYVVMYVMNKETIKTTSAKYFRERLSAVIQKLNDYSDTFDKTQTVTN
ncbi:MAG: hypothetical protein WAZ68_06415, partial [Leptotrichiaceae bacterium]